VRGRHRNQFAARDHEVQLNKLAPAAPGATHLEGQVDERDAPAVQVAGLAGLPRWPQVREAPGV
jgi:hypothetical protein